MLRVSVWLKTLREACSTCPQGRRDKEVFLEEACLELGLEG